MKKFIISFFLLLLSTHAVAEIAVIGNLKNKQQQLTALQVQDIYMGRSRSFPDGKPAYPFEQTNLRVEFYLKITQRPIAQIDAYWARLMFSGQTSPPTKLPDDQKIISIVQQHEGAIGYIDKESADEDSMRILLILK